jgi:hypothetical protein
MAESPKRPADVSRAEASGVAKPSPKLAGETSRPSDSVPMSVGPFAKLPTQFGRYRIDGLLGQGAMGAVYLAHDITLERAVALKVAKVSAAGSVKIIKRMEAEAKAGAKIDHPHICKVYDSGEIDGIRFIALQYIEGEDLKQYLKRVGRKREPAEAVRLIVQLARALQAAHDKGVVHRDLKPENVMLRPGGDLMVMDFGLALQTTRASDAERTQKGTFLGTAAYMSPEQARGKGTADEDNRSDIYAVGAMLFEMLTGEWPFTGTVIEIMGKKCVQDPPSPLTLNPGLNPELAAVCHKMIAQKKEDRYASCAEVATALESIDFNAAVAPSVVFTAAAAPVAVAAPVVTEPSFEFVDASSAPFVPAKHNTTASTGRQGQRRGMSRGVRWAVIGGAGAFLAILLAVTLIFRDGSAVVKVEVHADDVAVTFQNKTLTINNGVQEFKVTPGSQKLHVQFGDIEFDTDKFALKKGMNPAVTVELVESDIVTKLGGKEVHRRSLTTSASGAGVKTEVAAARFEEWDLANPLGKSQWTISDDGILKGSGDGWLATKADYANFQISLEYQLPNGGNSGVFLRASPNGKSDGTEFLEIQLLDDNDPQTINTPPPMQTGSLWKIAARKEAMNSAPNQWHTVRVLVLGARVQVEHDSKAALDVKLDNLTIPSSVNRQSTGRIGLQSRTTAGVRFRNIEILDLSNVSEPERIAVGSTSLKHPVGIKNGDFADGLTGWSVEGDTIDFRVFSTPGTRVMAMTTAPEPKYFSRKGRVYQSFVVPDKAERLECYLHGSSSGSTYVAIKDEARTVWKQSGPNQQTCVKYSCDITALRGKTVTFEIVDDNAGAYGYIGIERIRIVESADNTPDGTRSVPAGVAGTVNDVKTKVAEDITNGDFKDGLNGWVLEGGAANFLTFKQGADMALTTHGKNQRADTGRMSQSFKVPSDAVSLYFYIHGCKGPDTFVAILHAGKMIQRADAPQANTPVLVRWDLKSLRGEIISLEIVDRTPGFYIGAHGFEIVRESRTPSEPQPPPTEPTKPEPISTGPIPPEFRSYFERADAYHAKLVSDLEKNATELQAAIDNVNTLPVDKKRHQQELTLVRARLGILQNARRFVPFDSRPAIGDLGTIQSAKVIAKQGEDTVVVAVEKGAAYRLTEVDTKSLSMRPNAKVDESRVWQVVALGEKPSDAVRDSIKVDSVIVLKPVKNSDLESHRGVFEGEKKTAEKPAK